MSNYVTDVHFFSLPPIYMMIIIGHEHNGKGAVIPFEYFCLNILSLIKSDIKLSHIVDKKASAENAKKRGEKKIFIFTVSMNS